ncbi:MAG: ABC transporter ATP-binding protein [Clostridia bacterium]|nr:ABC transporter ATP-binding protein [Clostridia bacterium]
MIATRNIEKSFNGEAVLKGIDLEIFDGEFVSIMGKSGSGKSTLISIIGGFLKPDSGVVELDGQDLHALREKELSQLRCTSLGFVFQAFKLIPTLNVIDNIMLPLTLSHMASEEAYSYALSIARELGIDTMLKKFPNQLSGGQCQRVAIARALSYKPKIIILDEPTGALDTAMEKTVMELLARINKEQGTTVIQVTHSERVAAYGTRIIRIKDGIIEQ